MRAASIALQITTGYRNLFAAGTAGVTPTHLMRRAIAPRYLSIPPTTGMPHRPSSSDGQTSVFVSSNPIGLCYRLPKFARRYACLSLATGRLRFGCRSYRLFTAEGRCGMDSTESRSHVHVIANGSVSLFL